MIIPTVGRVVWYRPARHEVSSISMPENNAPLAAIVCHVWSATLVNLVVFDREGRDHRRTSVEILQDGSEGLPEGMSYCEWMPFQKSQAAKTEQLAAMQQQPGIPT